MNKVFTAQSLKKAIKAAGATHEIMAQNMGISRTAFVKQISKTETLQLNTPVYANILKEIKPGFNPELFMLEAEPIPQKTQNMSTEPNEPKTTGTEKEKDQEIKALRDQLKEITKKWQDKEQNENIKAIVAEAEQKAAMKAVNDFMRGNKLVLDFKSPEQVAYINEVITEALEAGLIKRSGDLLVLALSFVQGGLKITKPGFIPDSGKKIIDIK